jgi:hypothetical protein
MRKISQDSQKCIPISSIDASESIRTPPTRERRGVNIPVIRPGNDIHANDAIMQRTVKHQASIDSGGSKLHPNTSLSPAARTNLCPGSPSTKQLKLPMACELEHHDRGHVAPQSRASGRAENVPPNDASHDAAGLHSTSSGCINSIHRFLQFQSRFEKRPSNSLRSPTPEAGLTTPSPIVQPYCNTSSTDY